MKRILCLRLPNWPLQRLVVASQCRAGQAVSRQRDSADPPECGVHFGGSALAEANLTHPTILLYARDARRGECIVTCSRVAHACGVRPGMPLAEAQALVVRVGQVFNLSSFNAAWRPQPKRL